MDASRLRGFELSCGKNAKRNSFAGIWILVLSVLSIKMRIPKRVWSRMGLHLKEEASCTLKTEQCEEKSRRREGNREESEELIVEQPLARRELCWRRVTITMSQTQKSLHNSKS